MPSLQGRAAHDRKQEEFAAMPKYDELMALKNLGQKYA